jgi:hypothetical protein
MCAMTSAYWAKGVRKNNVIFDISLECRIIRPILASLLCKSTELLIVVQVDVEKMEGTEDGGIIEPDNGVGDQVQAAAEAVAVAEQPERELHSFVIDPAQVHLDGPMLAPSSQPMTSNRVCKGFHRISRRISRAGPVHGNLPRG